MIRQEPEVTSRVRMRRLIGLGVCVTICFVLGLMPHYGPPHFRYTGSDPNVNVWNLGWPLATMIWDARTGLHVGPFAYLFFPGLVVLGLAGLILAAILRGGRDNGITSGARVRQCLITLISCLMVWVISLGAIFVLFAAGAIRVMNAYGDDSEELWIYSAIASPVVILLLLCSIPLAVFSGLALARRLTRRWPPKRICDS